MKKIAFHIQKGGVGKTSISGNVAFIASQLKKTILIDCDPQGNSSSWYLTGREINYTLSDVLSGNCEVINALQEIQPNFFILPTAEVERELKLYAETKLFQEPYVFEDLNTELEALGFDIVVFDLSPGMSMLERCVLLACDEVITPMTPEYFSLEGLEMFIKEINKINKSYRRNVEHKKIVVNNLNMSFKRHVESYEFFKKLDLEIFTIKQDADIANAQFHHKSLVDYNSKSKSVKELLNLTYQIIGA